MADYLAIQDLNKSNRMSSTSGGFISLLANQLLQCGYSVYGAAFDDSMLLKHILVKNYEDVKKTSGSKYVQSNMGDTFQNIKKDLKKGNKVLFIGPLSGSSGYYGEDSLHGPAHILQLSLQGGNHDQQHNG